MNELISSIKKEVSNLKEKKADQPEGESYIIIKCKWSGDDINYSVFTERSGSDEYINIGKEGSLNKIMAGLIDGMWESDLKTQKIFYSKECLNLAGYDPDEVEGTFDEWVSVIHPEDAVLENMEAHIRGEIPFFNAEYRILCKNGRYRWLIDRGKVISWDEEGNPEKMIGMFIDVSLQKNWNIHCWNH